MKETLVTASLVIFGCLIGISDSVIGGGTLFTLSLLTLLGLPPLHSIATTQVVTLIQNLSASLSFLRKKAINWKLSIFWGALSTVGAYIGANIVINVDEGILQYIIAGFMIAIFIFVSLRFEGIMKKVKRNGKKLKTSQLQIEDPLQIVLLSISSFVLGIYGGFYGAARGLILLMVFFMISRKNLMKLAANTKIIDLSLSISSVYVFLTNDVTLVHFGYLIPISIGALIGGFIGVDIAEKAGIKYLKYSIYFVTISALIKLIFF